MWLSELIYIFYFFFFHVDEESILQAVVFIEDAYNVSHLYQSKIVGSNKYLCKKTLPLNISLLNELMYTQICIIS